MNISELCQFLEVSRAGYYRWRDDPIGKREQEALKLDVIIRRLFAEHKEGYGAERIRSCLKGQGMRVSVERVAKRMKLMNLKAQARRKYKVTTDSNHAKPISPNLLLQDFSAAGPTRNG
jgi:putative transposase